MKVYCVRLSGPTGESLTDSRWLTLGKEYVVISINVPPGGRQPMLQILADDRAPSWWPAADFLTVSTVIPSNWVAKIGEDGEVDLAPESWLKPGFWDAYSDRDKNAISEFDRQLGVMMASED